MTEPTIKTELPELKSKYIKVFQEKKLATGFKDIDVSVPDLHGDHFGSSCEYLTVHLENSAEMKLFVKRMVDNPSQNALIKDLKLFEKESGFFNILLPAIQNFAASKNEDYLLDMFPNCIFANEELIILENLTVKGYTHLDKVDRQDFDEAKVVMKTLAKFHAPSYLMVQEAGVSNFMAKYPFMQDATLLEGANKHIEGWLGGCLQLAEIMLQSSEDSKEKTYAAEIIAKLKPDIIGTLNKAFSHQDPHLCFVVNHGDCWNNNMMFLKDNKTNSIRHHVLVDLQVVRLVSPNLDLSNYMYTSLKNDIRRQEWTNLLRIYYDSFTNHVTSLGGTFNFSFEEFVDDYKRKFVSGLIFGVCFSGLGEATTGMGDLDQVQGDVIDHIFHVSKKWMEKNQEKTAECAKQIILMFQEYKQLSGNPLHF